MQTTTIPLDQLDANPDNPRVDLTPDDPEYTRLRHSIQTYGIAIPLVRNTRTGRLVSGHQRLRVLRDLGHTETTVVDLDIDPADEAAIGVALNKITGRWNDTELLDLLRDLEQHPDIDLLDTGFDAIQRDDLERIVDQQHAADFLDDLIDPDPEDEPAPSDPAPDQPDAFNAGWHRVSYVVDNDQRTTILKALRTAQEHLDQPTLPRALCAILEWWGEQHPDKEAT